jgi:uncharacterized protein with HEPN domain
MDSDEMEQLSVVYHSAKLIQEFVFGMELEVFESDPKCQSAVLWQLLMIGDADAKLPLDFRQIAYAMDWNRLVDLKPMLLVFHNFYSPAEIWRTAKLDIPDIISGICGIADPNEIRTARRTYGNPKR